jgi:hypothetical protein
MGQDWCPNKGLRTELLVAMLEKTKQRIQEAASTAEQWPWVAFGAYSVLAYMLSLRGVEGLLVDLGGMLRYASKGDDRYLVVTFLGKVKGEHRDRCHLLPCSRKTASGIDVEEWVNRLIQYHQIFNRTEGPAITEISGNVVTTKVLDEQLVIVLEELYNETPGSVPVSISSKEDVNESYQVFRSFRRSSDTRAYQVFRSFSRSSDTRYCKHVAHGRSSKGKSAEPTNATSLCPSGDPHKTIPSVYSGHVK